MDGFLRSHPRVPSHKVVGPQLDSPETRHRVKDVSVAIAGREQRVQKLLDVAVEEK